MSRRVIEVWSCVIFGNAFRVIMIVVRPFIVVEVAGVSVTVRADGMWGVGRAVKDTATHADSSAAGLALEVFKA